jgi:hypothetical protein
MITGCCPGPGGGSVTDGLTPGAVGGGGVKVGATCGPVLVEEDGRGAVVLALGCGCGDGVRDGLGRGAGLTTRLPEPELPTGCPWKDSRAVTVNVPATGSRKVTEEFGSALPETLPTVTFTANGVLSV